MLFEIIIVQIQLFNCRGVINNDVYEIFINFLYFRKIFIRSFSHKVISRSRWVIVHWKWWIGIVLVYQKFSSNSWIPLRCPYSSMVKLFILYITSFIKYHTHNNLASSFISFCLPWPVYPLRAHYNSVSFVLICFYLFGCSLFPFREPMNLRCRNLMSNIKIKITSYIISVLPVTLDTKDAEKIYMYLALKMQIFLRYFIYFINDVIF